jgi:hypothetical protein
MIKTGLRNFLEIEDAMPGVIRITAAMTFEDNAAKNRIWYRGDAYELSQLYTQIPSPNASVSFWGARSTPGMEIKRIHTGLPGLIVDTLTSITLTDLNAIEIKSKDIEERWERIAIENNIKEVLKEATKEALYIGDGVFKIGFDPEISKMPIVEWVPGDRAELVFYRKRLKEVIVKTFFTEEKRSYTLVERYGYGYLTNELYRNEHKVDLNSTQFTSKLSDYTFDKKLILAVPFNIYGSSKWEGRGQSIFDRKTDSFDSLDEAWSQWMDALRAGRTREYIPECFLPRDPNTGMVMKPNAFDNRFIKTDTDNREGATNKIEIEQPAIPHDSYLSTYITALDLALQGIVSPSTLGIDVKKLDNAEAQREKEKATLYTRDAIIEALSTCIPKLVSMTINAAAVMEKKPFEEVEATVTFGEYANPSFESQVETIAKAKSGGILSIEATIEELYGDSKTEEWKAQEVQRLKAEQGFIDLDEPSVNDSLGGFTVEGLKTEG